MSSVYGTPWLCQISFIGFLRKYRFVRKPFVCGRVFSFPPAGDMPRQPTAPRDFVHRMHKVLGENRFITKPLRPSTDGAAKLQRQVSSGSSHRCSVVQRIYRFLRAPRLVPRHITMMPSGIFVKVQKEHLSHRPR